MKFRFLTLAVALSMLSVPTVSTASPVVAGRVSLAKPSDGKVSIRRANGEDVEAGSGTWLYEGDQVSVTRSATVCIDLFNSSSVTCYMAGDKIPKVENAPPPRKRSLAENADSLWNAVFAKPRYILPSRTNTRGAQGSQAPAFEAHPLLSSGNYSVQFVPVGQTALHPVWRGPAFISLSWEPADSGQSTSVSQTSWAIPGGVKGDGILKAAASDSTQSLAWKVQIAKTAIPRPPELANIPEAELNVTDRVDRAAWILRDGPPGWRLYAVTELFRLEAQSYEAKIYLDYILSEDCSYPSPGGTCPFLRTN